MLNSVAIFANLHAISKGSLYVGLASCSFKRCHIPVASLSEYTPVVSFNPRKNKNDHRPPRYASNIARISHQTRNTISIQMGRYSNPHLNLLNVLIVVYMRVISMIAPPCALQTRPALFGIPSQQELLMNKKTRESMVLDSIAGDKIIRSAHVIILGRRRSNLGDGDEWPNPRLIGAFCPRPRCLLVSYTSSRMVQMG